jgi:hypothetical protein
MQYNSEAIQYAFEPASGGVKVVLELKTGNLIFTRQIAGSTAQEQA